MITLVILVISGIAAAVFATQNTQTTSITLGTYNVNGVPIYLVTLGAVLIGILVSFIISFVNSISTKIAMHGKDGTLSSAKKEIDELNKELHKLEIENTKLKTQLGQIADDNSM